jgi:hypothetical protein
MYYPVINQFLEIAIFRCATDKSAAPQLLVIVMVAEVVALRSTRFVKISTNASTPSWQFAKPTVRANTIWQRSRELELIAKLAPKSVPAPVVMDAVERAGNACKDLQLASMEFMFVTNAVFIRGKLCKDVHEKKAFVKRLSNGVLNDGIALRLKHSPAKDPMFVTDCVLNNGISRSDEHPPNIELMSLTIDVLNNGMFLMELAFKNMANIDVTNDVSYKGTD